MKEPQCSSHIVTLVYLCIHTDSMPSSGEVGEVHPAALRTLVLVNCIHTRCQQSAFPVLFWEEIVLTKQT